ncbi:MAG: RecX family transcriptional regulator [Anaerolineae bacterium]|jgi:regulatory protein
MAGKITALRVQKKRRNRVNVYVDGEFAFGLQDVLAAKLSVGQELGDDEIEALKRQDSVESAYEKALYYLSYRPRSEQEIERYLQGKGLDEEATATVLDRLRHARLVGDAEFAEFWVENRETFRPRGPWALRAELRQKGVADEIIDQALEAVDEEKSAMEAAERVVHRFARLDADTFWRRLMGYLQRRGFGYGVSRRVVDEMWKQVAGDADKDAEPR